MWFKQGVDALNACLHPSTAHEFREALLLRSDGIDAVHQKLTEQDMAWQPNLASTECISGATIWRMVIATMAFRSNWDFGDLSNREKILTSFLGQWESGASHEVSLWHERLCREKQWALSATFDWAMDRPAPPLLRWVFQANEEPSAQSMTRLIQIYINRDDQTNKPRWDQLMELNCEMSEYITHFLFVHQQLTGEFPDLTLGAVLAQSWKNRKVEAPSIASELFEVGV